MILPQEVPLAMQDSPPIPLGIGGENAIALGTGVEVRPKIGTDYELLSNKPQINGVELVGDKTAHDLGLASAADIPTDNAELANGAGYVTAEEAAAASPVQSVNGKTGDVLLTASDVGAASFWFGTRAEYNALSSIDPNVVYCIEEGT